MTPKQHERKTVFRMAVLRQTVLRKTLPWAVTLVIAAPWTQAFGQEAEEPPTILGQPAGWSIEPEAVETLIPIVAGSALRERPQDDAGILTLLPESKLPLLETRQTWVKVRHGESEGWVDLDASRAREGREQEPPPLEPRWEPGNIEPSGEIGAYTLWGIPPEPVVLDFLDRVVRDHLRLYGERYGLVSENPIGGDVRLISQMREFVESHRDQGQGKIDIQGNGYFNAPALVVIHTGRSSRQQLAATLLHELTHLLNWHFLVGWSRPGARVAPWLDEGMAEEMTFSASDRKGNLQAEPLGTSNLRFGGEMGALLQQIGRAIKTGGTPSLPTLLDMDHEAFLEGDRNTHYTLSALFIRYLVNAPELADRFRAFLSLVSEGVAADSTNLATQLDRTWPQLEKGFRAWIARQRLRFPS